MVYEIKFENQKNGNRKSVKVIAEDFKECIRKLENSGYAYASSYDDLTIEHIVEVKCSTDDEFIM